MIEYWSPEEPFELPTNLGFEMKSQTDLYEFRKVRASCQTEADSAG
jgi:peptidylprolyl isomerase domain and WD repeat-containing protein 1